MFFVQCVNEFSIRGSICIEISVRAAVLLFYCVAISLWKPIRKGFGKMFVKEGGRELLISFWEYSVALGWSIEASCKQVLHSAGAKTVGI